MFSTILLSTSQEMLQTEVQCRKTPKKEDPNSGGASGLRPPSKLKPPVRYCCMRPYSRRYNPRLRVVSPWARFRVRGARRGNRTRLVHGHGSHPLHGHGLSPRGSSTTRAAITSWLLDIVNTPFTSSQTSNVQRGVPPPSGML